MKNKYRGETVQWEIHIEDQNGTNLNSETPILNVEDSWGTTVLTGTGTVSGTTGSYVHKGNIEQTWGTGPTRTWWVVKGVNGTAQDVVTNEMNIVAGTVETLSYVYQGELDSYYTNILDYAGENTQDKLTSVYHKINRRLEALAIKAPRGKNPDGFYDQSLRDWNAWWGIYYMVLDWEGNRVQEGDVDPWYKKFWDQGERIAKDIKDKKILFRDQVTPADAGISKPERTAGSSIGTMYNNWDRSYGKGFQGADFERTWVMTVVGTGTAGGLEESSFSWSNDGGITSSGTVQTSFSWVSLKDEVYVRWDRGTGSGTTDILKINDQWKFTTQPLSRSVGGIKSAKSY